MGFRNGVNGMIEFMEKFCKKAFYTMAMARTVICCILLAVALCSCSTVEWAYSEASWTAHQIHFSENMDMPNCQWCIDYNNPIP